ncbi:active regulator of SIRT1-like [Stomoxys calcitrans]|uniref:Uncharacterized protein n=1 Tax=Stomoxys calcitrans TaxID=35570 RepID=A0A1I8PUW1_STOCA|nr:active regulator of SIRT1-like [Stomoxys calcitrans]
MSLKLLKQSVDIVEEEINSINESKKRSCSRNTNSSLKFVSEHQTRKQHKKKLQGVRSQLISNDAKSEENIKRLLALSMNHINIKDAEKIVQRAHKGRYVDKIIPKVEQESIFTEEDFRKFEEEYFNS